MAAFQSTGASVPSDAELRASGYGAAVDRWHKECQQSFGSLQDAVAEAITDEQELFLVQKPVSIHGDASCRALIDTFRVAHATVPSDKQLRAAGYGAAVA